jgi:hypothetical protein
MLSPEPHFPEEGTMVLPKSYAPYWDNQFWTYVRPGALVPLTREFTLSCLEHSMGFEIVTKKGTFPLDDLKLTRCELADFERMRSVPMKTQAQRLEDDERPTLHNLRTSKVHIFAGSFHGKSTFVNSNPLSAEAEMNPEDFQKRYPDQKDFYEDIATYYKFSKGIEPETDKTDARRLYEDISMRLINADIQVTVSHLTTDILDKAIESGRRIAYIVGDYETLYSRMIEFWDDRQDFIVASRSISALGYYHTLHNLNIRGPFYSSFELALTGLAIGADHVELPFSPNGDGGIYNS